VGQRLLYVQKVSSSAQYRDLFSAVLAFGVLGPVGGGGRFCVHSNRCWPIPTAFFSFLFVPLPRPASLKLLLLNCINGEAFHCVVFYSLLLGSDILSTLRKPFVCVLSFISEKPLFCKYVSNLFVSLIFFY
jgi:hypothetical protein